MATLQEQQLTNVLHPTPKTRGNLSAASRKVPISMNSGLSSRTFVSRLAAATLFLMAAVVPSPAAQRRITSRIDDTHAVALPGNLHPQIRTANDEGRVNPSMPLSRMMLTFRLSPTQQRDLDGLLAAQQDSTSPLYHQWLTPEQIGARFGLAQSDLDQVTQRLAAPT